MVLVAIHITKNVGSVGALRAISSMPAYMAKIFTDWCAIYSCHMLSHFTEKLLLRLTMKIRCYLLLLVYYVMWKIKAGLSLDYACLL